MAKFVPGTDTSVKSDEPKLDIAVDAAHPLAVGKNVFSLVVTDDSGNDSAPASVTIIVTDTQRPTAVVDFLDAAGVRNPAPQVVVPFGTKFSLTGERSSDVGGKVKAFNWTLTRG